MSSTDRLAIDTLVAQDLLSLDAAAWGPYAALLTAHDHGSTRVLWFGYVHDLFAAALVVLLVNSCRWRPLPTSASRRADALASGLCPRCGYDTRGLPSATCPECAEALA